MNIIEAVKDEEIFRPFLGEELESWRAWMIALRALYGLPIRSEKGKELVCQCTGRDIEELPEDGFNAAIFLVGRRSGKSRIAAVIGAFEALFGEHETRLAKGETGIVPIISPSRYQSTIVWNYLKAIFDVPILSREIADRRDIEKTLTLRNGLEIRILTGDWRTVRGPAVVCAILDELCFFGYTEESKVRSDTELVRAVRPALMTTGGKLIGISSKYAQRGYAFQQWKRQHGRNKGDSQFSPRWRTLVWDCPSRVMNPTLSQAEIDREFEEDPAAARSEFGGEWREDVAEFVPRSLIESLVVPGRKELMVRRQHGYRAGLDLSGGRTDSAALAIVHKVDGKIVVDFLKEWKAPHNPYAVVAEVAAELKRFGLIRVEGDAYAGEWPVSAFRSHGIRYRPAKAAKNELYRELLPILCGGRESIELLDDSQLINQLAALERRPRSGGKDIIDHPTNGKDDVANALAVAVLASSRKKRRIGAFDFAEDDPDFEMRFNRQVLARVLQ